MGELAMEPDRTGAHAKDRHRALGRARGWTGGRLRSATADPHDQLAGRVRDQPLGPLALFALAVLIAALVPRGL